jgi:hypothetical protein
MKYDCNLCRYMPLFDIALGTILLPESNPKKKKRNGQMRFKAAFIV